MIKKALRWLDENIENHLILFLYVTMVGMLFIEVIKRYVFKASSPYAYELATFMFLWIIFLGMSYGFKLRSHIVIDVLPKTSPLLNLILELLSNVITTIVLLVLIYYTYDVLSFMSRLGMKTDATELPLVYFMFISIVCFFLTIIRLIQNSLKSVQTYKQETGRYRG